MQKRYISILQSKSYPFTIKKYNIFLTLILSTIFILIFLLQPYLRDAAFRLRFTVLRLRDAVLRLRDTVFRLRDAVFRLRDAVLRLRFAVLRLRDAVLRLRGIDVLCVE